MPRNMSFVLTQEQIKNRTKTVTRRVGWHNLKPGELFYAVEKCQGLKKGEKVKKLALLRCVSNEKWLLSWVMLSDVRAEGFPKMSEAEFVEMFCKHMKCQPGQIVQRIVFTYED